MAEKKVSRLRFTKNELTDEKVRRAAAKAERAADRAETAQAKLPKKVRLRFVREGAAHAHVARTVCRRAERRVIALSKLEPVDSTGLIYLNRLSDLLFAVARRCNVTAGCPEVVWKRRGVAE